MACFDRRCGEEVGGIWVYTIDGFGVDLTATRLDIEEGRQGSSPAQPRALVAGAAHAPVVQDQLAQRVAGIFVHPFRAPHLIDGIDGADIVSSSTILIYLYIIIYYNNDIPYIYKLYLYRI